MTGALVSEADGARTERLFARASMSFAVASIAAFAFGYLSSGAPLAHREGESIVAPMWLRPALAVDLRPGVDGLRLERGNRRVEVPVDQLLREQVFDRRAGSDLLDVSFFADERHVVEILARKGSLSLEGSRLFRVASLREEVVTKITQQTLLDGATQAGYFLTRIQSAGGTFQPLLDGATGKPLPEDYSWARHAGVTFFLAELARATNDPVLHIAAERGVLALRERLTECAPHGTCVEVLERGHVGTTALATLAMTELDAPRGEVRELLRFLRASRAQGPKQGGSFDRATGRFQEVTELYTQGQVALALTRGDSDDVALAKETVDRLLEGWSFFGSRYYFSQEHWTCQGALALSRRGMDLPHAREFCERVQAYEAKAQLTDGSEDDGGFAIAPLPIPQVAQAAARAEGWIAAFELLEAQPRGQAKTASIPSTLAPDRRSSLERLLAFLLRRQKLPPHLLADPAYVAGGFPASRVDWRMRMDVTQHAGSALLRAWKTKWFAER